MPPMAKRLQTIEKARRLPARWLDALAVRLVRHSPLLGRVRLFLMEAREELLARGRIDAHRRIACPGGAVLDAWVLRGRRGRSRRGAVLFIHGLWDSKAYMFGCAQRAAARGFDAVLVDLRGHGLSTGRYVTYGARETPDLLRVMSCLQREGLIAGPRFVVGFSMGGGIAVQYAAADPACRGLIALAPVAAADLIMRRMVRIMCPLLGESALRAAVARAGEMAGFEPAAISAIRSAEGIRCPAVVIHGRLDLTVPPSHGQAVFDALAGPKELIRPWTLHSSVILGREDWIARKLVEMARHEASSDKLEDPGLPTEHDQS